MLTILFGQNVEWPPVEEESAEQLQEREDAEQIKKICAEDKQDHDKTSESWNLGERFTQRCRTLTASSM